MKRNSPRVCRRGIYLFALAALSMTVAPRAHAQTNCLPGDIEKYAAKASSRSDVNLDRSMLGFAGNFMNDKDDEEVKAKQLLRQINAIVVHTYEFDEPGAYNPAELESIRTHYKGADWSHIVSTREHGKGKPAEASDIWMHMQNGKATGMVILNAEEKELDFVCIDGTIDPTMLSHLSGQFGIPQVPTGSAPKNLVTPQQGSGENQ